MSDRHDQPPASRGDRLAWAFYALCAFLLVAQLAVPRDGPLAIENWIGIHALIGLAGVGALLLVSRLLRPFLSRPEDYYDR